MLGKLNLSLLYNNVVLLRNGEATRRAHSTAMLLMLFVLMVMAQACTSANGDDLATGDPVALTLRFDWSSSPGVAPPTMRLWVLPEDGSEATPHQLSGHEGGTINVPYNRPVTIVAVNGDAEGLEYSYSSDRQLMVCSALTSALSPLGRGDEDVPRAEGTENDPVHRSVSHVYAATATGILASRRGVSEVTLRMTRRTTEWEVELRNVENLENALSVSATMSGMASAHKVVAEKPAGVNSIVPFSMNKIDESTLRGNFCCFGHCPLGTTDHKIVVYAVMKLGSQRYQVYGDGNDVVNSQVHVTAPDGKVRVVLYGMNLPESTEGTPMEPTVDDWLEEKIVVKL